MKPLIIIYKTDKWHSYASRDIIGIATSLKIAIGICKKQAKKEGQKLAPDTLTFLSEKLQTQDYEGDGEFHMEQVQKNVLL